MDRHGTPRLYVRVPGQRKIRLRVAESDPRFEEHYRAALLGIQLDADPSPRRRAPPSHTFAWLAQQFFQSPEYQALEKTSQETYRSYLDSCAREETRPGSKIFMEACPIDELGPAHIRMLRDRKRLHPFAANGRVRALRRLFAWAIEAGQYHEANPARDVGKLRTPHGGHPAWRLEDVQRFERHYPVGSHERLALGLLLYTGQRASDVARMGPEHVQDGWLVITQTKNSARRPVRVEIPILPALQALLDVTPIGEKTFLVTQWRKPFTTAATFSQWFRLRCAAAGLPGLAAHGLRKAMAALLVDLGATPDEVMAVTGHAGYSEIARYSRSEGPTRPRRARDEKA
jgi:integrase